MEAPSSGTRFGSRPKALVCHICGREFGTKSLAIHVKACTKKWEDQEALKPRRERRPVPKPPSDVPVGLGRAQLDERNAAAMAAFEQQAMKKCPNCGRTFLEDRLPVHLRSCTAENPHKSVNRLQDLQPSPSAPSGLTLQAKVPAKQRTSEVSSMSQVPSGGEYQEVELRECRLCGRGFAADRLSKHEAVCGKSGKRRPVFQSSAKRVVDPIMSGRKVTSSGEDKSGKAGKWKREHQDFINAIRYSKKVEKAQKEGVDIRTIPAPPSSSNYSDYVNCPYCGRNYAPQTAERHIPRCATIVNKPKPPPSRRFQAIENPSPSVTKLTSTPKLLPSVKSKPGLQKSPSIRTKSSSGMSRSTTEAFFRQVLKPCPGCKKMYPNELLESHLLICANAKPTSGTSRLEMKSMLRAPTQAASTRQVTRSTERIKPTTSSKTSRQSNIFRQESGAQGSAPMKVFCNNCGTKFLPEGKFCASCGTRRCG